MPSAITAMDWNPSWSWSLWALFTYYLVSLYEKSDNVASMNEKKWKQKMLSHVLVSPWTVACQASLYLGFPRQEYWSGLPFSSPGDLSNSRFKPMSLALAGVFFTMESPGKAWVLISLPCLMGLSRRHETHGSEKKCSFLPLFLHWSPKPQFPQGNMKRANGWCYRRRLRNIITVYSGGRHCIIQSWKQTCPLLGREIPSVS